MVVNFQENLRQSVLGFLTCLIGALVCCPSSASANMAPVELLKGGGASPKTKHQTVRMDSEQVIIRLGLRSYTVSAVFHFFNTGETVTEWVGFAKRAASEHGFYPILPDLIRFEASVDGRSVEVKEETDPEENGIFWRSIWGKVTSSFSRGGRTTRFGRPRIRKNRWPVQRVTFPSHMRTTIRTTYEAKYIFRSAYYAVGTGRLWKDSIGKAVVLIDSTDVGGTKNISVIFQVLPGPISMSKNLVKYEIALLNPPSDAELIVRLVDSSRRVADPDAPAVSK